MKSVTRTFCIIWAVLSLIVAIIMIVMGSSLSMGKEEAAQVLIDTMHYTHEQAILSVENTIAVLLAFGFVSIATVVYSIILAVFVSNEKIGKIPGIVMGSVGIVLGSVLPGILFIVDSVQSRGKENTEKEEEKPAESK